MQSLDLAEKFLTQRAMLAKVDPGMYHLQPVTNLVNIASARLWWTDCSISSQDLLLSIWMLLQVGFTTISHNKDRPESCRLGGREKTVRLRHEASNMRDVLVAVPKQKFRLSEGSDSLICSSRVIACRGL